MAHVLYADGEVRNLGHAPDLQEAQELVGGYVEVIYPVDRPNKVVLCDEDGRSKHKPANPYGPEINGQPLLCGDIVVMTLAEAQESGWSSKNLVES